MQELINKLPLRFQWTLHNVVSHPLSEIAHLMGFEKLSRTIHDITLPKEEENVSSTNSK